LASLSYFRIFFHPLIIRCLAALFAVFFLTVQFCISQASANTSECVIFSHVSVPPLGVLTLARGMSVTTLNQVLTLNVTLKANSTTAGTWQATCCGSEFKTCHSGRDGIVTMCTFIISTSDCVDITSVTYSCKTVMRTLPVD